MFKISTVLMTFTLSFLFSHLVWADDMTDVNDAVKKTQQLMNDPKQRQEVLNKNESAKKSDEFAAGVVGSQNMNEMYSVAADILPELTQLAGGDPTKMMQILAEAQKNPEAFTKSLSPGALKKIRDLAGKASAPQTKP